MAKLKEGDRLTCEVCGLAVVVDEACGCAVSKIICCEDTPMVRKKSAAPAAKGKCKAKAAAKPAAVATAKAKAAKPKAKAKKAPAKKPAATAKK